MWLEYVALGFILFVILFLIYATVLIHDIPYMIAVKRNHPHQDAIHTAGWISLFFLNILWPFLWIWATLYRPQNGWGFDSAKKSEERIKRLEVRLSALEKRLVKKPAPKSS